MRRGSARRRSPRVLDRLATIVASTYDPGMKSKERLSASIDAELLRAAERAVARGTAASVSAWVNEALRLKVEHDRRLEALAEFLEGYEAEHGEIPEEEIRRAQREARGRAVAVRGRPPERAGRARRDRRRR